MAVEKIKKVKCYFYFDYGGAEEFVVASLTQDPVENYGA